MSVVSLIKELNKKNKDVSFLITTVTLSSSNLVIKKLENYDNIEHRFFPIDTVNLVKKFLDIWSPKLVIFIDSEIWPNFLSEIKRRNIPLVLINARITKKSFNRWNLIPDFAQKIFKNFDLCLAGSEETKNNLIKLNAKNIKYIGNLKFSSINETVKLNKLNTSRLDNFNVWCAASTHDGEEIFCLNVHRKIKQSNSNLITIIIPRHINRVQKINKLCKKLKLKSQILNENQLVEDNIEVLIINSFGVLSKYFQYCNNVFIGKSMIEKLKYVGGQNPIEAAQLGCKIFHGPYVNNFKEVYNFLKSHNISTKIDNENDLSNKLIENFKEIKKNNIEQVKTLRAYGDKILEKTLVEINKLNIL